MGKVKAHTPKLTKKFYPLVSVCTPTFNRRPFISTMFECFLNQDYPRDRVEWIIVDDGTDCIKDLIDKSGISQIRYFREEKKMALGEKRNYMHSKAKGTIIVYMDDDDYYPPERISHAVDTLAKNKDALCVGSSEIYVYFKHIQKMYQSGPYSPTHATAGTFAFRTELLKTNRYENHAALAEEKHFLNNYTVPFAQLDPLKTILVFSHQHNTFDKRKLLDNPHPDYFRESNKTISMFIRQKKEEGIKNFFLKDIDALLKDYEPGEPKMKPDVLAQITVIEADRKRQMEEQQRANGGNMGGQLVINQEGQPPRTLTNDEIVQLMNQQIEQLKSLSAKTQMQEQIIANLQKRISELSQSTGNPGQINISPTVSAPAPAPVAPAQGSGFVDTLMTRINELEKEIALLRSSKSTIIEPSEPIQKSEPSQTSEPIQPIQEFTPIIMKSKSMPEVMINI